MCKVFLRSDNKIKCNVVALAQNNKTLVEEWDQITPSSRITWFPLMRFQMRGFQMYALVGECNVIALAQNDKTVVEEWDQITSSPCMMWFLLTRF